MEQNCRMCLQEDGDLSFTKFSYKLDGGLSVYECYKLFTSINLKNQQDRTKSKICLECLQKLLLFYNDRCQAISNNDIISSWSSNDYETETKPGCSSTGNIKMEIETDNYVMSEDPLVDGLVPASSKIEALDTNVHKTEQSETYEVIEYENPESPEESVYSISSDSQDETAEQKSRRKNAVLRKKLRQSGKEYVDKNGDLKSAKFLKGPCKKCKRNCIKKIPQTDRRKIFNKFWSLSDNQKQVFMNDNIVIVPANHPNPNCQRKIVLHYFLENKKEKHQICANFFKNTLDVSKNKIFYHVNKRQSEAVAHLKIENQMGQYMKIERN